MAENKIFTSEDICKCVLSLGNCIKGNRTFYIEDGELKCGHRYKTPLHKNIIVTLSQTELRDGLTSSRWDFVEKRLLVVQGLEHAKPIQKS